MSGNKIAPIDYDVEKQVEATETAEGSEAEEDVHEPAVDLEYPPDYPAPPLPTGLDINPSAPGPIIKFEVHWSDLRYVVDKNFMQRTLSKAQGHKRVVKRKTIFDGLNGEFKSGELTALMGPSGAGKSTLLECIANRRVRGRTGRIFIKGSLSKVKMAFIPQHDNYY